MTTEPEIVTETPFDATPDGWRVFVFDAMTIDEAMEMIRRGIRPTRWN